MKKIILGLMACAALCACTNEDIISSSVDNAKGDDVYMKFNLTMSTSTRSATGETTEEQGQTYENNVGSVLVVLTDGSTTVTASANVTLAGSGDEYVATFPEDDVTSLASQNVNVYVFCNPDASLLNASSFSTDATYNVASQSGVDETPWAANAMFMSNYEAHVVSLPASFTAYNSASTPYELGTVNVERSIARFDYKDGSEGTAYTYTVSDNEGNEQATITLAEVALVNLSSEFYHLRRVASSNTAQDAADLSTIALLGAETANNWVIDTDVAFKSNYAGESTADYFSYILGAPSTWEFASLTDDLTDLGDESGYGIWRYATENTIPAIDQQKKGITSIAVFKGLITPVEGGITLPTDGSRIYVFDRVLYGTWDEVATAATEGALKYAYDAVMEIAEEVIESGEISAFDEYNKTISKAMEDAGFTGYSPDENNDYYAYYYYYNQHNDDSKADAMGIMEYAVVRNNVYKLSVTDITAFGHPTPPVTDPSDPRYPDNPTPDPDPDPEDPDDPVVDTNTYFRVDVQILPWTVRVNDITF